MLQISSCAPHNGEAEANIGCSFERVSYLRPSPHLHLHRLQSKSFVALLRLRRNRADRQVFDHARAQQADGFVGDGDAPLVSESCTAQDAPSRYRVCLAPAAAIYRASGLDRMSLSM